MNTAAISFCVRLLFVCIFRPEYGDLCSYEIEEIHLVFP